MTEQISDMPTQQPTETSIERTEYSPVYLSRLAGAIGRLGVGPRNHEAYLPPQPGHELSTLLDHYQGMDEVPELDVWPDIKGDLNQDAEPILEALWASPILERPVFLSRMNLKGSTTVCKIKAHNEEWARLRVRNFVHAPGVSNWNEGNTSKKSKQIIRSYARKEEPLKPIDLVAAYVQPNGVVLYSALRDGSHRLSAAHLRGEKSIPISSRITVSRIAQNVIPITETRLPSQRG